MAAGLEISPEGLRKATRKEVFAWALYDWANSAYSTLSITFLAAYLQRVVFPVDQQSKQGAVVWALGISSSMLLAAVLSPLVGAIADRHASKRRWLALFALSGAALMVGLSALPPSAAWAIVALFFAAHLMFELSLGVYNGFLPELAGPDEMDRVSAWGFALGYTGGGLALLIALGLLHFRAQLGIADDTTAIRINLALTGLWWGLFTLPTLAVLRDRGQPRELQSLGRAARRAAREVFGTLRNIRRYRTLALFLIAFLFYNEGVQTVISQASTFALELQFDPAGLALLILMVQFVAMIGAMLLGEIANRFGPKPALMGCLAVWSVLVTSAYFIHTHTEFWILGVVLALVLGGTQSVSRSIMGMMTPPQRTAEFFGFFNLSGKATSFAGPAFFALVIQTTGTARLAILSLIAFFLVGWGLAAQVSIKHGRQEALADG